MKKTLPREIIVHWDSEDESLDLSRLAVHGHHGSVRTKGFWSASGQVVEYNAVCETEWRKDGSTVLNFTYEQTENWHLKRFKDLLWGSSRITIAPRALSGLAEWRTKGSGRWYRRKWTSVERLLISTRVKKSVVQYERHQAALRDSLLRYDKACAISAEKLPSSLDAAHIIGVARGGTDVHFNMLLLRADIHRLYDSGHFKFQSDGTVRVLKSLSPAYSRLIRNGASIPSITYLRVRDALRLLGDA